MMELAAERPSALLCYERDPACCHRTLLWQAVAPDAEVGIDYVHLRALGTPAAGREAARAGRKAELERIYAGQLETPEAMAEGAMMLDLAAEKPSALLCYERDPACCHRTLLWQALAPHAEITDLFT